MRHQPNNARRMRGRSNHSNNQNHHGGQNNGGQRRGFQNKNRVFDSNGPDVRIRGTAFQIVEKYLTLAKDAQSSGDRVMAESYLQHAEHYQRMITIWTEEAAEDGQLDNGNPYEQFSGQPPSVSMAGQVELKTIEGGAQLQETEDLGLPSSLVAPRKTELTEA